jgi:heat-inducible transcriptional repressor
VVQYPSLSRSSVRHVEVVMLAHTRLLLVLITDTGRVEQRVVELPMAVSDASVAELRATLNAHMTGRPLADAGALILALPQQADSPEDRTVMTAVVASMLETLVERFEDRIVLAGTANLTRNAYDFPFTIRPVLEALEEQVTLLKLFGEAVDPTRVSVRIGEENPEGLTTTAVVSTAYGAQSRPLAGLAVLGPTRMDYPGAIGAVGAVARYVGQILAEG